MSFALLAQQWAPGSRSYVRDIAQISEGFYGNTCNTPDPRPELVQEARKGREQQPEITQVAEAAPDATAGETDKASGAEIARRAIEEARKEDAPRTGLGAAGMLGNVAASAKAAAEQQASNAEAQPAVTLINPAKPETKADASDTKADAAKPDGTKGAEIQTASVAGAATQLKPHPAAKASAKCKVWTASYGGQRAIIIKAMAEGTVNYTVLDVNETSEKREVDAYIAAYAKGGESIGAFTNQTKALDKAFELCPEG
jgi:hypothetical protein